MNTIHVVRASLVLLVSLAIGQPALSYAGTLRPSTTTQNDQHNVFLPMAIASGQALPTPPTIPPNGNVVAELVGTWFSGAIPPTDFYNPTTGEWRSVNGLGQMYRFNADGSFTYAGFLRLQNGQCLSEVSVYKQGKAQTNGVTISLTPNLSKTRTVIVCGSHSDSTVNGSLEPYPIGWSIGEDQGGRTQLVVTEGTQTTTYSKEGMAPQLAGAWHNGAVVSTNFYDARTQTFTPQTEAGTWFRFNADGTYSFGEFGYGRDNQGCELTGWIYLEGTLSISGSKITTTPRSGVARVENACKPGQVQQQPYTETAKSYAWLFRDRPADPKLVLIPLEHFEEFIFTRE